VRVYVFLNSPGGDLYTALAIGLLLRAHDAATWVRPGKSCASACLLIFGAGVDRESQGTLVVHRPYFVALPTELSAAEVQERYRNMRSAVDYYAEQMNLSAALVELMFSVPPENGRAITDQEAAAFGLQRYEPVFDERIVASRARAWNLSSAEFRRRGALVEQRCSTAGPAPRDEACTMSILANIPLEVARMRVAQVTTEGIPHLCPGVAGAAVLECIARFMARPVDSDDIAPRVQQTPAQTPAADARPELPAYQVEGFRSARFNMSEREARDAINRDFPAAGTGIRRTGNIDAQTNRVYRTTALVITVRDLMPDTGTAQVEYILGYQSRKLIQVNVIWGTPADPQSPLYVVQTIAARLRTFFLQENFPADRRATNVQQGNELVMFRGRDPQGRTVEVVAQVTPAPREGQRGSHFVRLSYILNPEQPDVYTVRHGDF
jgi:hypothetical protein